MDAITHKRCAGECRQLLPLEDFYVRLDNADGRRTQCKLCYQAAVVARQQERKLEVVEPEPKGWPVPAPADPTVQLLNLHNKRAYGAVPMGRAW